MDLNKDNKNIYTIDSKSYSQHMQDNWKEPKDVLSTLIKVLFIILLVVMGYFFYKIVKADLSFSEVFNKKELLATYEFFNANDKPLYIKEEALVLVVNKKNDEPTVEVKIEEEKIEEPKVIKRVVVTKNVVMKKEISDDDLLSSEYLRRISEGMNSF